VVLSLLEKNMAKLLRKRIWLWHIFHLPLWWCKWIVIDGDRLRQKAKLEDSLGSYSLQYSAFLAVCFNDRSYIDETWRKSNHIQNIPEFIQADIHTLTGAALYDLGHKISGLDHLEKAVRMCPTDGSNPAKAFSLVFVARLNNANTVDKRLEVAERLVKYSPNDTDCNLMLCKTYIDKKMFGKFDELIDHCVKKYGFLLAEYHFAKGNFKAAVEAYEKYKLPDLFHYWRAQYDYKRALAYHYCDQPNKTRKEALRIKRRLKWDRFYRLSDLDDIGIERVAEIDSIIYSDQDCRLFFDPEKAHHYLRAFGWILHFWLMRRWYVVSIFLALGIILLRFFR